MRRSKFHSILSFLLLFFLSSAVFFAEANPSLFFQNSNDGNVIGYLNIKTPHDGPYRIYEADIYLSMTPPNPCEALPSQPTKAIVFSKNVKIDLVTATDPISESAIEKITGGAKLPLPVCLQIATFHTDNHTGAIFSNKVLIPAGTGLHSTNTDLFDINLTLH